MECSECNRVVRSAGLCTMHYARKWRTGSTTIRKKEHQSFFEKDYWINFINNNVDLIGGCWIVNSRICLDGKGYPVVSYKGKLRALHRLSYEIFKGAIPVGLGILHACDTPKCVNPEHLRTGTPAENSYDMVIRERSMRGSLNGRSKLTEVEISKIRKLLANGYTQKSIAKMYGVGNQTINNIALERAWKHVRNQ